MAISHTIQLQRDCRVSQDVMRQRAQNSVAELDAGEFLDEEDQEKIIREFETVQIRNSRTWRVRHLTGDAC
jgi:hypothetical protein